jgi:hypothetical protein
MGLTDTAIKRSRPAEKPYKLADGKGLYLWSLRREASCGAGSTA